MRRRHYFITITLLCCVLGIYLYVELVYTRTQSFVHNHVTPPFEAEATDFFYDNLDKLNQLTLQMEECDNQTIRYIFNSIKNDISVIPPNILKDLEEIEENTEKMYSVYISQETIRIMMESGTDFEIFLSYKYPRLTNEWDKITPLVGGWELHASYVIRH